MKRELLKRAIRKGNNQVTVRTGMRAGGTQMDELIKKAKASQGK